MWVWRVCGCTSSEDWTDVYSWFILARPVAQYIVWLSMLNKFPFYPPTDINRHFTTLPRSRRQLKISYPSLSVCQIREVHQLLPEMKRPKKDLRHFSLIIILFFYLFILYTKHGFYIGITAIWNRRCYVFSHPAEIVTLMFHLPWGESWLEVGFIGPHSSAGQLLELLRCHLSEVNRWLLRVSVIEYFCVWNPLKVWTPSSGCILAADHGP